MPSLTGLKTTSSASAVVSELATLSVSGNTSLANVSVSGTMFSSASDSLNMGNVNTLSGTANNYSFYSGPFIRSSGWKDLTSNTHFISFCGSDDALLPFSSVDNVLGVLTLYYKSTGANGEYSKIGTNTRTISKPVGSTMASCSSSVSSVFKNFTTTPSVQDSGNNDVKIVLNDADVANTKISWMFQGAL